MTELCLDGAIGIREIGEQLTRLRDALSAGKALKISCGPDLVADLSLIQLLIAARRSATKAGKQISLAYDRGSAIERLLQDAGLTRKPGQTQRPSSDPFWAGSGGPAK